MKHKALAVGLLLLSACVAGLWITTAFVEAPVAFSPSQGTLLIIHADDGLLRMCWCAAVDPDAELRAEFEAPNAQNDTARVVISCVGTKPEVQTGRDRDIGSLPRSGPPTGAPPASRELLVLFFPDRQGLSEAQSSTFGLLWQKPAKARRARASSRSAGVPSPTVFMHWSSVRLPLWAPTLGLAIYPMFFFVRGPYRRYRRRRKGLCCKCGYDLTGNLSGVCSECGEQIQGGQRAMIEAIE